MSCYKKSAKIQWVAPMNGEDSEFEVEGDTFIKDDDTIDPDFILDLMEKDNIEPPSKKCRGSPYRKSVPTHCIESDEEEEEKVCVTHCMKTTPKRMWKNEDINHPPMPRYHHTKPTHILTSYEYFDQMFPMDLVEHIVNQTNLYARQKDVSTTFATDINETTTLLGILLYMGIVQLPSFEDYWAHSTHVPQVADKMSSKRFRQFIKTLHFSDNKQARGNVDRFYKIRPVFNYVTKCFLQLPATPAQSIDEVMVAYKGTRAGNLRKYIRNKPDKWGFQLFCRGSTDGIIHDILIYQGNSTFFGHPTKLSDDEETMNLNSKLLVALTKTLQHPERSAVYANDYFTSIEVIEYLKEQYNCRYTGTVKENRIGFPGLKSTKDMALATTPKGSFDYTSSYGILAMKWKNKKVVKLMSSDAGVEPLTMIQVFDKSAKIKKDVLCPSVITQYSRHMSGKNNRNLLIHLYKTPLCARRWYIGLFGYVLDMCVCNAWLLYKRDCDALDKQPMPLKAFRLDISCLATSQKLQIPREIQHTNPRTSSSCDQEEVSNLSIFQIQ